MRRSAAPLARYCWCLYPPLCLRPHPDLPENADMHISYGLLLANPSCSWKLALKLWVTFDQTKLLDCKVPTRQTPHALPVFAC